MSEPDRAQLRLRILEIARSELALDQPIDEAQDLSLQLDSVQRLTLVVALEDAFEICFDPEEDEEIRSLEQVIDLVARKVADVS